MTEPGPIWGRGHRSIGGGDRETVLGFHRERHAFGIVRTDGYGIHFSSRPVTDFPVAGPPPPPPPGRVPGLWADPFVPHLRAARKSVHHRDPSYDRDDDLFPRMGQKACHLAPGFHARSACPVHQNRSLGCHAGDTRGKNRHPAVTPAEPSPPVGQRGG